MELLLFTLGLVSLCRGQVDISQRFCHRNPCPGYTLVSNDGGYEVHKYDPTKWLTTTIASQAETHIMDAHFRLTQVKNNPGYVDSWPVLITVQNGNKYYLSWFVAPGFDPQVGLPDGVSVVERKETTYYVRVFSDRPSIDRGLAEKKKLCQLIQSKFKSQNCENTTYYGAGYDPITSLTHHNEIWIEEENETASS